MNDTHKPAAPTGANYNPKGYYGKVCFGLEEKHWYGVWIERIDI